MPKPTSKHKFAIGIYVTILLVIILVIWARFLKYEIKINDSSIKEDGLIKNFGEDFDKLIFQSSKAFQGLKDNLKLLNVPENKIPDQVAQTFFEKAQEELHKRRITDWLFWQAEGLSFRYPANWTITPQTPAQEYQLIILNSGENLKIEISFTENLQGLDAVTWWQNKKTESQDAGEVIISGQTGFKVTQGENQFLYLPFNNQMMEVKIVVLGGNNEELQQQITDFIQTIDFSIK